MTFRVRNLFGDLRLNARLVRKFFHILSTQHVTLNQIEMITAMPILPELNISKAFRRRLTVSTELIKCPACLTAPADQTPLMSFVFFVFSLFFFLSFVS